MMFILVNGGDNNVFTRKILDMMCTRSQIHRFKVQNVIGIVIK